MVDNGTGGMFGLLTEDNGSSWTLMEDEALGTANGVDSISLTVDPVSKELVMCANDDGTLVAKKFDNSSLTANVGVGNGLAWIDLVPTGTAVDNTAVDCAYNSDGTKIGMSYISGNGVSNFQIFYDD